MGGEWWGEDLSSGLKVMGGREVEEGSGEMAHEFSPISALFSCVPLCAPEWRCWVRLLGGRTDLC